MGKSNSKRIKEQEEEVKEVIEEEEEEEVIITVQDLISEKIIGCQLIFKKSHYNNVTRLIRPDWSKIIKNHLETKQPLESFEYLRPHKNDCTGIGEFLFLNGRFGCIEIRSKKGKTFFCFEEERSPIKVRNSKGEVTRFKQCIHRRKKILPLHSGEFSIRYEKELEKVDSKTGNTIKIKNMVNESLEDLFWIYTRNSRDYVMVIQTNKTDIQRHSRLKFFSSLLNKVLIRHVPMTNCKSEEKKLSKLSYFMKSNSMFKFEFWNDLCYLIQLK